MSDNGTVLRLTGVGKSFREPSGPLPVLRELNLNVNAGEIVLLQGPSGSGKTTLLQIAGCLLRADGGRIEIEGQEINGAADQVRTSLRQRNLGFCFQHFHLLEALTVRDNVMLGLRLKRQQLATSRVDKMLEHLGLTRKADKIPRDLSGGEKQRTAFARALVGQPRLLLADEPTSQLDAHAAETVADLIRTSIRESGCAALITTHDARLHPIANRICTLKEGKIYE